MKKSETYRRCEHCNQMLLDVNPPTREQYDSSMIHIENGSLLLPREVKGSNARSLDGVYCGPECLAAHIRDLLAECYQEG